MKPEQEYFRKRLNDVLFALADTYINNKLPSVDGAKFVYLFGQELEKFVKEFTE